MPLTNCSPGGRADEISETGKLAPAPPPLDELGVVLLPERRADREQLDTLRPGLERADGLRCDADRVPQADVDRLVPDLDSAGAAEDDVDLLLAGVPMPERRADAGREALGADGDLVRLQA